ncbi:ABC transporter ATP-binding protein [Hathewaya histolytica]|uniref:ABC transporter ATP-binding protein n=1 Tax=Hathewaya histolytica TaxID=1498 RepID=UPI003B67ABB9
MINIVGVEKSYNGKDKVIENLNLVIPDGKIFGFLGPNGAGKTTTIKMITGIINPDKGSINIGGNDIIKKPLEAKKSFGFVPDNPDIFLRLKGIEYLNFMGDIYEVSEEIRKNRIESLCERFDMKKALGDKIQSYSHGMRQKIVIMGVLIHDPDIWILDEPLTGLDPKSSFILKEMMREHAESGKTVLFSTHVLEVAEKLCDIVAIINKGKVLYCGDLETLRRDYKENESLENIFLELTKNE